MYMYMNVLVAGIMHQVLISHLISGVRVIIEGYHCKLAHTHTRDAEVPIAYVTFQGLA